MNNGMDRSDGLIIIFSFVAFFLASGALYLDYRGSNNSRAANLIPIGRVLELNNNAKRKAGTSLVWHEAKTGSVVYQEDWIFTGSESSLVLSLDDGSRIELQSDSIIVLRDINGLLDVDLTHGHLIADLKQKTNLSVSSNGSKTTYSATEGKFKLNNTLKNQNVDIIRGDLQLAHQDKPSSALANQKAALKRLKLVQAPIRLLAPKDDKAFLIDDSLRVGFEVLSRNSELLEVHISESKAFTKFQTLPLKNLKAFYNFKNGGTYYWRAYRKGDPSSITPTFRLNLLASGAPLARTPAQGQKFTFLENLLKTDEEKVNFEWEDLKNIWGTFELQVSDRADFKELKLRRANITSQIHSVAVSQPGVYHWRVRGLNPEQRLTSRWSQPRSFAVQIKTVKKSGPVQLTKKELVYPLRAKDLKSLNSKGLISLRSSQKKPKVQWQHAEPTPKYRVSLSDSPSFESPLFEAVTSKPELPLEEVPLGLSHFQVEPIDALGRVGPAQAGRLKAYVPSPKKLKTVEGSGPPELHWSSSQSSYGFQLRYRKNADAPWKYSKMESTSFVTPWPEEPFQWQVRSYDLSSSKGLSYYSRTATYQPKPTNKVPDKKPASIPSRGPRPTLIHPEDRKTYLVLEGSSQYLLFRWTYEQNADSYELEIARDRDFSQILMTKMSGRTKKLTLRETLPLGTYYFRARAIKKGEPSEWSAYSRFRLVPIKENY